MRLLVVVLLSLWSAAFAQGTVHTIPEVYSPGETRAWVIEQGGVSLGHCVSHYAGEVELGALRAHRFQERVLLEVPQPGGVVQQRFTIDFLTDAGGRPLRFDFRSQAVDIKATVDATFAEGKVEMRIDSGGIERPYSVDAPASVRLLANNFVSELDLLLSLDLPASGEGEWTLFSVNALRTLPYSVKPVDGGALQDSLGEKLVLEGGRLARVEMPAQKIVIRRVEQGFEPFTIELEPRKRPEDLDAEDVAIVDGDVHLAGTITRPKGASGRLPAVFFLSGSGGQDRDGFSDGLDVGTHEILDDLTRAGFLVLRVDDRGVGASTGPLEDLTFDDLVEDGRRAVEFLLKRPDVDPARVALIGHSEGGLSAPILATREPIAALVLMAAPARSIDALLVEQLRLGRQLEGGSPEEVDALERDLRAFLAKVREGGAIATEGLAPELAAFLPARAWLRSHLGRDPLAVLRQVHCPVLILQGARDVQVSPERDAPRLLATLEEAGHHDHELHVFPELDHLFKRASGEHTAQVDYLKKRPVDPEFLATLRGWLAARLRKDAGSEDR